MGRAFAAIVTTVTGLVLLLSFKSHTGSPGTAAAAIAPHNTAHPSPSTRTKTSTPKATTSRTVTGATVQTRYGPVQVQVTLRGSRITEVSAVQLPQQSGRDIEIDNFAVPVLHDEALSAQSAHIDTVSGATYTSEGYIQSLQSALDSAGI